MSAFFVNSAYCQKYSPTVTGKFYAHGHLAYFRVYGFWKYETSRFWERSH